MPSTSGEKISYNLRLAKHIERKMFGDAFQRLNRIEVLSNYRYIGFGSFYFTDFALFHRRLGIAEMISIEGSDHLIARCEHNKPFDCITVKSGYSNDVLESILTEHPKRTILWLDYDRRLDTNKLRDIETAIRNVPSGSVIIVSVAAFPGDPDRRIENLRNELPEGLVPDDLTSASLGKWGTAKFYRGIINETIERHVRERALTSGDSFEYRQLFNFHYQDGAPMLTVGGLVYNEQDKAAGEACNFGSFPFYRDGDDECLIDVPRLTYKELRYLDAYLPTDDISRIDLKGIPEDVTRQYASLYRYFPAYADADI